ncbi:S-adenosyl-L-methionine-dependent methyltransferase [Cercophora scortea]|uniref:Protein-lysine N-methyltransferase EFM4 n=1 Tax=Cercophora scortea TaxID=314031 RepID=A0AAE0IXR3_9PEZI|nr:S-adenosyl-L-methionine-dependent methyltransferase [Cercophora scortea]
MSSSDSVAAAAAGAGVEKPGHLEPSELGTKQYWDNLYTSEIANHASNPADTGTVWFDDSDAEAKMVAFLDAQEHDLGLDRADAAVLDLGCGNGSLLFALRDDGWAGRLLGVDYSEKSVALARRVGAARDVASGDDGDDGGEEEEKEKEKEVEFKAWDVLNGSLRDVRPTTNTSTTEEEGEDGDKKLRIGWDLVLDKGTFDAISLSDELDSHGRRICEGYGARVLALLRPGGVFLVTSCNWTEAELTGWFERASSASAGAEEGARLRRAGRIQYRSFSFGGVQGQTISTLCFVKEE